MDVVVANLKVLSRLEVGERLATRGGRLVTRPPTPLTTLLRFLRAETRESSLKAVETLVDDALRAMRELRERSTSCDITRAQNGSLHDQLLHTMATCDAGIRNLASTYDGDTAVIARLEVVAHQLRTIVATLNSGTPTAP